MKIAIITLHRARNYGSILQAYALQEYFERQQIETEIIDYYPQRYHTKGLLKRLKGKNEKFRNPIMLFAAKLIMLVSYVKKAITLDRFLDKFLNMSKIQYSDLEELKKNLPIADAYCTGSDQVWNSFWNEGIEKSLYLEFVPKGSVCFSYAASFGEGELKTEEFLETKKLLEKYQYISVRENSGVEICRKMDIKAINVLDPTLILPREVWMRLASKKMKNRRYLLTYNLHHDLRITKIAKKIAKENGLKIYNISYNWHDCIKYGSLKWCPSVEDFLGLFKYAEYIVTDSFHACVFSIIFKKKFLVVYPEKASTRIESLLNEFELSNRGINSLEMQEEIYKEINWEKTYSCWVKAGEESKNYLNNVIKLIQEKSKNG